VEALSLLGTRGLGGLARDAARLFTIAELRTDVG
jgi:hypothetical protein